MGLGATRGAVGLFLLGLSSTVSSAADGWTTKHEAGRCAIRGQCGKQGFFGSELPCPDNGLAKEPTSSVRQKLVSICGDKWAKGAVCCEDSQVSIEGLHKNIKILTICPRSLTLSART